VSDLARGALLGCSQGKHRTRHEWIME
jgi:hypothetical protein